MELTEIFSNMIKASIADVKDELLNAISDVVVEKEKKDVWVSSKAALEEELGWGRSIIDQMFQDPDLQDAIITYGPRTFSVNVTLLRKLIKKKNHHSINSMKRKRND